MRRPQNATGIEEQTGDGRLHWPAPARNKDVILDVLKKALAPAVKPGGVVLEIGAGSGQHTAHFAPHFAEGVWQATDPDPLHLKSIQAWISATGVTNAPNPIHLDTRDRPWPVDTADAVLCINMIHISPWDSCIALFDGAADILTETGAIYLYGPFAIGGQHTAPSNAEFDQSLRARDASWGVRDLDDVTAVAESYEFKVTKTVEMPSNNMSVVFKRAG